MFLAIIVRARSQFIKIASLIRKIEKSSSLDYHLLHAVGTMTPEMSKADLGLHGEQMGRMLIAIDKKLVNTIFR